jgi:uncharacterized protein (UPF0248 family)
MIGMCPQKIKEIMSKVSWNSADKLNGTNHKGKHRETNSRRTPRNISIEY